MIELACLTPQNIFATLKAILEQLFKGIPSTSSRAFGAPQTKRKIISTEACAMHPVDFP
jgi:hypothetical protein